MPLKFTMANAVVDASPVEGRFEIDATVTSPTMWEPPPADLAQKLTHDFMCSVLTMRGLGDLYQEAKARVEKGEAYLRSQIRAPVSKGILEQYLALEVGDERARGLFERLIKLAPGQTEALQLMQSLREKMADFDRRVGYEADLQYELEKRIAGPGRYMCTYCWRPVGPGQCRCWEEDNERAMGSEGSEGAVG